MAIQAQVFQDNLLGFPPYGNSQGLVMESGVHGGNGCGMNFNSQQLLQKQLQQQILLQHQRNQSLPLEGGRINGVVDKRLAPTVSQPQGLHAQIDQQDREIDQYLRLQNERLRLALQEHRKQQMTELLKRVESKTHMLMTQKDQEIAQAAQKTAELQELLARLEMECEAWRRLAEENEAMVVSLNNTLDELMRDRACSTSSPSESCYVVENRGTSRPGAAEEGTGENSPATAAEAVVASTCRGCGSRGACMLFLPCRHLCACAPCSTCLDFCPVCSAAKKACIEAVIL